MATIAALKDHVECLKILVQIKSIEWNMVVDIDGESVLSIFVREVVVEGLKLLSEIDGIDWNVKSSKGITAPMLAIRLGYSECVKRLARVHSIDWNLRNSIGQTAAFIAVNGPWIGNKVECLNRYIEPNQI